MIKKLLVLTFLLVINIPAFSQTVETAWVKIYDDPYGGYDRANALAVDFWGNVYVTGVSAKDYATIMYYHNGDTAWVRRYHGRAPRTWYDAATDIGVRTDFCSGTSVYVTGTSATEFRNLPLGGLDYATIMYNPDGSQAWEDRWAGLGDDNYATGIAVDYWGNVYVTGRTEFCMPYCQWDYGTISATGSWQDRYVGFGGDDRATDITVDRWGNVYVTGYSEGLPPPCSRNRI